MTSNNAQEKDNGVKIPTSNGIGIFAGPMPEEEEQSCSTVFAIMSFILAIIVIWLTALYASELIHYVPAVLCIIPTFILIHGTISGYRIPKKPKKTIDIDGIWISSEKIWWGKTTIEYADEHFHSELYLHEKQPIDLTSEMTMHQNQNPIVDTEKGRVTFQIAHPRNNDKDYKIAFIHIAQEGKDVHSKNLLEIKPILVVDGKLYAFKQLSLTEQLRKVADSVKLFENKEVNPYSLLITPRTPGTKIPLVIPLVTGAIVGAIAQSFADSKAKDANERIINAISQGEFIDPEIGKFVLELMQDYKWEVGYRPLGDKELTHF